PGTRGSNGRFRGQNRPHSSQTWQTCQGGGRGATALVSLRGLSRDGRRRIPGSAGAWRIQGIHARCTPSWEWLGGRVRGAPDSRRGPRAEWLRPPGSESGSCGPWPDRKSTRLNSSHVAISYAVFCLKKKKKTL